MVVMLTDTVKAEGGGDKASSARRHEKLHADAVSTGFAKYDEHKSRMSACSICVLRVLFRVVSLH